MIKAKTLDELEAMLEKARIKALKLNPHIELIEIGLYSVDGSKRNSYTVRAGRTAEQEFFIACTCRAGLQGKACYHSAKVFEKHKQAKAIEIRLREKKEQEESPYLKQPTGDKPSKIGNIRI